MRGVLLYSFVGETDLELEVNENDIVEIIEEHGDGWSTVSHESKIGLIPTAYYDVIIEDSVEVPVAPTDGSLKKETREPGHDHNNNNNDDHDGGGGDHKEDQASSIHTPRDSDQDAAAAAAADKSSKSIFGLKPFKRMRGESIVSVLKRSSPSKPVISGPRPSIAVMTPRISVPKSPRGGDTDTGSDAQEESDTETADSFTDISAQTNKKSIPRSPRPPPKCSEEEAIKLIRSQLQVYTIRKKFNTFLKDPQFKSSRTRNELIRETLSTERTYVNFLDTFVQLFCEPIKNNPKYQKILDPKQHKLIFSNVEQIVRINQMLLNDLEKDTANWPKCQIGSIFKNIAPFLKAYTIYINNFDSAFENFERFEKRIPKFKEFLSECYASPKTEKHKFDSFLILPVQRIPRYKLLLQDILKNTSESHVEYADLKVALDEISNIASFVNEKKREKEQSQILLILGRQLKDRYSTLVQPNRQFVREGKLKIRSNSNSKGINDEFNVYFFSDVMIALDTNEKKKISRRAVHFIFLGVTVLLEKGRDSSCEFTVGTYLDGCKEVLIMTANSPDERALWEADLESGIEVVERHFRNKGVQQSLVHIGQKRFELNENTGQCKTEHDRLDKEFISAEKKLQKIELELSTSEQQLKQLIDKIRRQRAEKVQTEKQLDDLQSTAATVRHNLDHYFNEIRTHDQQIMTALEEEDAFKQIFGEVPSTEQAHNAEMPQGRPYHEYYTSSNTSANVLIVDNIVVQCSESAVVMLPGTDNRKSLPSIPPGAPKSPMLSQSSPSSPPLSSVPPVPPTHSRTATIDDMEVQSSASKQTQPDALIATHSDSQKNPDSDHSNSTGPSTQDSIIEKPRTASSPTQKASDPIDIDDTAHKPNKQPITKFQSTNIDKPGPKIVYRKSAAPSPPPRRPGIQLGVADIERLAVLRDKGILTNEEFEIKKNEILLGGR